MIKEYTINLVTSVTIQMEVEEDSTFEENKEYIEDNLSDIIAPYADDMACNAHLNDVWGDAIEEV